MAHGSRVDLAPGGGCWRVRAAADRADQSSAYWPAKPFWSRTEGWHGWDLSVILRRRG